MKHYLYSIFIVLAGVLFSFSAYFITNLLEDLKVDSQIPINNSGVAGIQKYSSPPRSLGFPPPKLSARAVLVKDLDTGTILYQVNANTSLPIASTTKIMTALVASQYFKPNSVLVVKEGSKIGGASIGLKEGETLSFRSLLYGMLLSSGNDAAFTIAENYPGGILGFVSNMNKKADELNLKNTHFDNPAGFDNPNHFSSALDLSLITEEAIKDATLSKIFSTKETEVFSLDKKNKHGLHNLNKLLSQVAGVLGVKTGYTEGAKENLVTLVDREDKKILTVVLGSDDRFGESTQLIEWTYTNYQWPQ